MVEDVFNAPAVRDLERQMLTAMLELNEWTTLSIDATCQVLTANAAIMLVTPSPGYTCTWHMWVTRLLLTSP